VACDNGSHGARRKCRCWCDGPRRGSTTRWFTGVAIQATLDPGDIEGALAMDLEVVPDHVSKQPQRWVERTAYGGALGG
jgi:hypothetical protein